MRKTLTRALMAAFGCGALVALAGPAAATAAQAAPAENAHAGHALVVRPAIQYEKFCNSAWAECLQENGNGDAATLTVDGTSLTRGIFASRAGIGYYEYYSASDECVKADPGISGDPVVFATCESSGNTEAEELWSDPLPVAGDGGVDTIFDYYDGPSDWLNSPDGGYVYDSTGGNDAWYFGS